MKSSIEIDGKAVYGTPNGLKIGTKGKVTPPGIVFGQLDKGSARKLRKELHRNGFGKHAKVSRIAA